MSEEKYKNPPYSLGECYTFTIPYKVSNTCWQKRNRYVNIKFYVQGDLVTFLIPSILGKVGYQLAKYDQGDGTTLTSYTTAYMYFEPDFSSLDEPSKDFLKYIIAPSEEVTFAIQGVRSVKQDDYDPYYKIQGHYCKTTFGNSAITPMILTLGTDGKMDVAAVDSFFFCLLGDFDENSKDIAGIFNETLSFSGNGYTPKGLNNIAGTNIKTNILANQLAVTANNVGGTGNAADVELPHPDLAYKTDAVEYDPTLDTVNFMVNLKPVSTVDGNGADPGTYTSDDTVSGNADDDTFTDGTTKMTTED